MKAVKIITLLCFLPVALNAAPRQVRPVRPAKKTCIASCRIPDAMLYRDPSTEKISEKERDSLMFTHFVGIVISFVKLFLDPKNIPEAKQNAVNILHGINSLAHVITRSTLSPAMKDKLVDKIIEICQESLQESC